MGRRKTVIEETEGPEIEGESGEQSGPAELPQELSEYLISAQNDSEYVVYLYRFSDENKSKWQITKYYNECPDTHQIGIKYGPGRYQLAAQGKAKNGRVWSKNFNFNLDESYARLQEKPNQPAVMAGPVYQQNPADQIKPVIELMRQMTSVFLPLLQANNPVNMMAGMNEVMVKNQVESFRQLSQLQRELMHEYATIREPDETDDDQGEAVSDVEKIIDAVKMFLPQLTATGRNPVAQMVLNQARQRPEFKRLISDNKRLILAIRAMERDSEIGPAKVQAILKKFGLKRPQ